MCVADRILIVDDHAEIREPLSVYLRKYGLDTLAVADGAAMRDCLEREKIDMILLDVMLPGEDGLSLCRYVYEHARIPVILLTAMSDTIDRVAGLELGADDYVTKPFDPRELVARIRGVFRRVRQTPAAPPVPHSRYIPRSRYAFEGWMLDIDRRELTAPDGEVVDLSIAEFRLLRVLVENPNVVLGRERLQGLMKRADCSGQDRGIDTLISRLRKKLCDDPRNPQLLRTVWGDGYLFAAEPRLLA